jgi:hypothetical protein
MLTTQEICEELAKVTYKDGWRFIAYDGVWEGQHLVITALVPDAYRSGRLIRLEVHSMLPPIPEVAYLHRWLAWRLGRIELHEMREFYRIDGVRLFDPHAHGAEHDDPHERNP